jgi:hypothetical protein
MSRDMIDDLLHRINLVCISEGAERTTYDDLSWYIATGRASVDFIADLNAKLKTRSQIKAMINRSKNQGTTENTIRAIRNYVYA